MKQTLSSSSCFLCSAQQQKSPLGQEGRGGWLSALVVGAGGRLDSHITPDGMRMPRMPMSERFHNRPKKHTSWRQSFQSGGRGRGGRSQINPSCSCFFRSELWEGINSLTDIKVSKRCDTSALKDSDDSASLYKFIFPQAVCEGALSPPSV